MAKEKPKAKAPPAKAPPAPPAAAKATAAKAKAKAATTPATPKDPPGKKRNQSDADSAVPPKRGKKWVLVQCKIDGLRNLILGHVGQVAVVYGKCCVSCQP